MRKRQKPVLTMLVFGGMESLLTGDLINVGGSHIVVVDFYWRGSPRIKKHSRTKTCKDLSVNSLGLYLHPLWSDEWY